MSIKSTNSNVESVTRADVSGLAIGGVMLAATIIAGVARLLNSAGRKAFEASLVSSPLSNDTEIKSIAALRAEQSESLKLSALKTALTPLDKVLAAKVKTMANLSATPYFISDRVSLEQSLSRLQNARTIQEVTIAEQALVRQLKADHTSVLIQSVSIACSRAALKVGFANAQAETAPDGTRRMIAVDPAGRALVTEISAGKNYDVAIATEIVGVSDGSCAALLNSFEGALENEGVRRTRGKRSYTGGVCELAAARDFIRRKIKPKPIAEQGSSPATTNPNAGVRRTQHLNNQIRQEQRKKH